MQLPAAFISSMQTFFQQANYPPAQLEAFLASFADASQSGLRVNRLKTGALAARAWQKLAECWRQEGLDPDAFSLKPVPWCNDGCFFAPGTRPALTLAHKLGLFYIQEPSAMLPAVLLQAQPGQLVLDLCAAPGGKSLRLAADLRHRGCLVANEINDNRARVLLRNLEQQGVRNCVVSNASPEKLAALWPQRFDKVLVDAPCSGEGMFRRDHKATGAWEAYGSASVSSLQQSILDSAVGLLKPGGELLYSTCTFNPDENERQIAALLQRHPELRL
ncbi:MAG: RsmB/NOP family class I SAM-dependent RNA methyltransferase, partial [Oscillospiraceae bacterium]|nr:RsmB/NOP family class I SAM-dependent RNA methyltransferase [Oscillospiraceae bacterium]